MRQPADDPNNPPSFPIGSSVTFVYEVVEMSDLITFAEFNEANHDTLVPVDGAPEPYEAFTAPFSWEVRDVIVGEGPNESSAELLLGFQQQVPLPMSLNFVGAAPVTTTTQPATITTQAQPTTTVATATTAVPTTPTTIAAQTPEVLAFTGAETSWLVVFGGALVICGLFLSGLRRRLS